MTSTISRRQILSRSKDTGLNQSQQPLNRFAPYEDYEEMWFSHEHLFKDHIAEVLRKWEQIDDEIWAKMIFMCRNRRIAKAYVRVPAVIIDGTDNGFDGYRVGLNGFEDPFRDSFTDQLMSNIEKGCRIGIDDNGNILIKRYSMSNVYVKSYPLDYSYSCVDNNIIRSEGCLELQKKYVLFDLCKFEKAMINELKSAYPDRSRLEQQCIVIIGFVRDHPQSILDMPCYVMLINIVALDMLKSKLNPVLYRNIVQKKRVPEFVSIFQQLQSNDNDNHHSNCCSEDDYDNNDVDDDHNNNEIYGKLINNSPFDKYYHNRHNGYNNDRRGFYSHEHGPQSMPTLINIHHHHQHNRDSRHHSPLEGGQSKTSVHSLNSNNISNKPPKLPPRDKKKLSRQINTIKSARKNQKNLNPYMSSRSIEIPSPDYNHNEEISSSTTISSTSNTTLKAKSKTNRSKHILNDENIYGTIMNNNNKAISNNHNDILHSTTYLTMPQRGQNGRSSSNKKNWPITLTINDRYDRSSMTKSMPSNFIRNNNDDDRAVTCPSPYHNNTNHHHHSNSSSINRTYRGDHHHNHHLTHYNRHNHLDEDPYYSGLEARVTSNRLHHSNRNNQGDDTNSQTKTKGLNSMIRKVLSTNYINMLTSRRQKKQPQQQQQPSINNKISKSKSSTNESTSTSTDSDPYASINDVYEPIYGYGSSNNNNNLLNSKMSTNNGWTTIQSRIK